MIVALVRYCVRQGYEPDQIAVLTPYVGQLLRIRAALASAKIMMYLDERDADEADAVDDDEDDASGDAAVISDAVIVQGRAPPDKVSLRKCVRLATVDNFKAKKPKSYSFRRCVTIAKDALAF